MRLRLVKVMVQPFFVWDDEQGDLSEVPVDPVSVAARDWPTYATGAFEESRAALEEHLSESRVDVSSGPA